MADPQPPRLFTVPFLVLAICELAYFTAAGLTIPLTPLFAEGPLGANELWVGISVGAFSVTALLLRPFAGRMSDRRGRRSLLIGGALLAALAIAAHAVTVDLWQLIVLRLVLGVAEAYFFVAGFAALADLAPPGREGEALSYNSLALYLGIAFGPVIGEVLLGAGDFELAWLGGAAIALGAALLAALLPETATHDRRDAKPGPLLHPAAIGPGLALFTGIVAMAGFLGFVALHARDVGLESSGGVLLVFGMVVVACRVIFARLPDRVPPYRLGAGALLLTAVGLGVVTLFGTPIGLFIGAAVAAAGVAFITPAMFAAVFVRVPPAERGAASGTTSVFIDLAFGGGPVLVGAVAGFASISAGFGAAAGVAAVGAVATPILLQRRRRQSRLSTT